MSTKAEDTQKNILDTARKHFLQDGLTGASLRNIVKDDLVASSCRVFFCLFCRKESEVEFITHIFLRFSGSDTAASWSDYEVEKPDTL